MHMQVPVRLTACECAAAATMAPKSPPAEEAIEQDGKDDTKYVYAAHGLFPSALTEEAVPVCFVVLRVYEICVCRARPVSKCLH
jgi:hypothetical protein